MQTLNVRGSDDVNGRIIEQGRHEQLLQSCMRWSAVLLWVQLCALGPITASFQTSPSMDMTRKVTQFETKVYQLCKQIPAGMISTYGEVAKALKTSPRAVGQALKRNPYAPEVPCHRVVSASRDIGGFFGESGSESEQVQRKRRLLEAEGVQFEEGHGGKVCKKCLYSEFMSDADTTRSDTSTTDSSPSPS